MKTAVSVPDQIFQAAEHLAHSLGITRSRLYSTALARFVEQHDQAGITARLDQLYASQSSEVEEDVQELQASSLSEGDW